MTNARIGIDALDVGEHAEQRGDYAAAADAYRRALATNVPAVLADAHFRLGRVAWRQGRLDEALREYDASRAIAEAEGDEDRCANADNGVGAVHYARGAYAQARAAYQVALERSRDDRLRARILLNLGVIANIQGDLRSALELYLRSEQMFRDAGDRTGGALALHNLGMLHADRHEWDEAEEAFATCLAICEADGNRPMVANILLNRSEVLSARGQQSAAVAECERALAIYDELGDELGRAEALRWKGSALRQLRRLAEAERALRDALRIAERRQNPLLEAETAWELGRTAAAAGQAPEAGRWLALARERFTGLGAQREADAVDAELASLAPKA